MTKGGMPTLEQARYWIEPQMEASRCFVFAWACWSKVNVESLPAGSMPTSEKNCVERILTVA